MKVSNRHYMRFSLILFSLLGFTTKAQNWAPDGAQWIYGHWTYNDLSGNIDYRSGIMNVFGDTIIQGKVCSKIVKNYSGDFYDGRPSVEYMYESNDSVFFFDTLYLNFQLLYNFNATSGEFWYIKIRSSIIDPIDDDSIKIVVNDINSVTINGNVLVKQDVTYLRIDEGIPSDEHFSTIIEGLGDTITLFNYFDPVSVEFWAPTFLRCYEDLNLGHYEAEGVSGNCFLDESNHFHISCLNIYPNPVHDEINFSEFNSENIEITIYSIDGKEVMRQIIHNQNKIDVSNLQSGSYIIQILVDDSVYVAKFIKE